jgi:predicted nucleic acid-binding protein
VYRANPRWRLIECQEVMEQVWRRAAEPGVARRQITDTRIALTLRKAGVTELATANVDEFRSFGFERVWDPTK